MLKSIPAVAAVLLISLTPAVAADLAQKDDPLSQLDKMQSADQNKTAQSTDQAADDDDIQVIIMGKGMQVQVPNPYKNPSPRMLSDAWAMRT
jgi:hypothetical protein